MVKTAVAVPPIGGDPGARLAFLSSQLLIMAVDWASTDGGYPRQLRISWRINSSRLRSAIIKADPIRKCDAVGKTRPAMSLSAMIRAMRPHHWLKNGLVFVPILLNHDVFDPAAISHGIVAFIAFSLLASSIYLLN